MAQLSEQDLILLNGYLDGRLSPEERTGFESRLAADRELRIELEGLRDTIGLLKMAERVPAPRNFTLTLAMAERLSRRSLWDRLGLASIPGWAYAGASLVVVLLCVGALVVNGQLGGSPTGVAMQAPALSGAANPAATEAAAEMLAAEATEAPTEAPLEAATEQALFSAQMVTETPAAAGLAPAAPTQGPAAKFGGDQTPAGGEIGLGGPPGGMGGGVPESASPLPQPTEAPNPLAPVTTERAAVAGAEAQTDNGVSSEAADQAAGARNLANGVPAETSAAVPVTEAQPFAGLTGESWALLLGGTVLLVVIVLVVTAITRRR